MLLTPTVTLASLKAGQMAVVEDVDPGRSECERLQTLGLCCGTAVRMLRPGSTCAIQVGDCRLVICANLARSIRVTVV